MGLCPFHAGGMERTPSFVIYLEQNSWHCYSCGEGSDVIGLVMKLQNLKFIDAIKFILNK
jgi:DNA primase